MQEMTHQHTRELNIYYNEHKKACTNCVRAVVKVRKANSSGVEKDIDIEKLIAAIYISPYAPKWFEDVVYDVVKKYGLNKPIFHSEMAATPFY